MIATAVTSTARETQLKKTAKALAQSTAFLAANKEKNISFCLPG